MRYFFLRDESFIKLLESECNSNMSFFYNMTVWPSGLRRWLEAPVRRSVGANHTSVSFDSLY